jgi:hypothetical protein
MRRVRGFKWGGWILIGSLGVMSPFEVSAQSAPAASTTLELKRLSKCAGLFLKERISESDPLWLAVRSGQKNGTEACMEILALGEMDGSGQIPVPTSSGSTTRGSKVLNSFVEFHRGQLVVSDYSNGLGAIRNAEIHDVNSPAYHFVYSALKRNEPYSAILTRTYDLRAKRYSLNPNRREKTADFLFTLRDGLVNGKREPFFDFGNSYSPLSRNPCENPCSILPGDVIPTCTAKPVCCKDCVTPAQSQSANAVPSNLAASPQVTGGFPWYPVLVETGILNGLIPATVVNSVRVVHRDRFTYRLAPTGQILQGNLRNKYFEGDVNEHLGAGFIGSQTYLLMNNNKALGNLSVRPDGGIRSYRLWAKHVLEDALCLQLPALRSSDVIHTLRPNSEFPWRSGIACMSCHQTMDTGAGAIRNLFSLPTSDGNGTKPTRFFMKKSPTQPGAPYPEIEPDPDFSDRPAQGLIQYRSYDGSMVEIPVDGIQAFGQALANTQDFYACGAKRYFEWLTGVPVNLGDISDPLYPVALTNSQKLYRNRVIELGKQLKQNQSVKELLRSIISSETFVTPDRGL